MDIIQGQRETRELIVNTQYIAKMVDGEAYEGFNSAWAKMRTISARKEQICSSCFVTIHYMEPMNVYLALSHDDGHFHRQNMCMNCMMKERRQTASYIATKFEKEIKSVSVLNTTHLRNMTLEKGEEVAQKMCEDAIYLHGHIPANVIVRDGMYLYENIRAVTAKSKHYCYRCSAIIPVDETTFVIPAKVKSVNRQEMNFICQTCATKSLRASSKRIEQYEREKQL